MSPKPDAAQDIRGRVAEFAARQNLTLTRLPVLIGFSGGADSTALLLLLRDWTPDLVAIHLHHGIRDAAADRDAAWCARFCRVRQIPFELHHLDVPRHRKPGEGLEEAARRCRLEFWTARAAGTAVVALGHHADDQLEELFLRLLRGANCSGLAGLRPLRVIHGVHFIRPLLCLRRAEIEAFLRADGVRGWRHDHTNADCRLRRNAVRHKLLPLLRRLAGTDQGLLASLFAMQMDAEFLEQQAAIRRDAVTTLEGLRGIPPALLPRTLRGWLHAETGQDVILGHDSLARLRRMLCRPGSHPWQIPLGCGLFLACTGNRIAVTRGQPEGLQARTWEWQRQPRLELPEAGIVLCAEPLPCDTLPTRLPDGGAELFAATALPATLTVRAWQAGDRLQPFGSQHDKKLQDLFTDKRIPRWRRPLVPVLLAAGQIIWVPQVRRAEFGRLSAVNAPGQGVVRLSLDRIE